MTIRFDLTTTPPKTGGDFNEGMMMIEFKEFPKITRENPFFVTITEKIDGTNACVIVEGGMVVGCQSRKRLITINDDNYGFAQWVQDNKEDLSGLGDGYHFGEWAGLGIQKNPHNLKNKEFFLFNTGVWNRDNAPLCCNIVPVLFEGEMDKNTIPNILYELNEDGLRNGERPEGVVVYHHALRKYTKHTIKSPNGKWCKD